MLLSNTTCNTDIDLIDYRDNLYYNKYTYRLRLMVSGARYVYWCKTIKEIEKRCNATKGYAKVREHEKQPILNSLDALEVLIKLRHNKKPTDTFTMRIEGNHVSVFSNKSTNQVALNITGSELQLAAQDVDFSFEGNERMKCQYNGEDLQIAFNAKFLVEMLSGIDSGEVIMELSTPSKAGILKPSEQGEGEELLMLVMHELHHMMLGHTVSHPRITPFDNFVFDSRSDHRCGQTVGGRTTYSCALHQR